MTTDTIVSTLTIEDLRAIRNADAVCFRTTPERSAIECIKKDRDEFGDKERRREIEIIGTVYNGWDEDGGRAHGVQMGYGFVHIGSAQFHETFRTVASLLKVGDSLQAQFRTDEATNGYCKDARLHADVLYLRVERTVGGKPRRLFFHIDETVTPDNSSRMVKRTAL